MAVPENAKQLIIDGLTKKTKTKSKFYLKDFNEFLPGCNPREVKNVVNSLVADGTLEYWSSGSSTMIGLKGMGKQAATEHEE